MAYENTYYDYPSYTGYDFGSMGFGDGGYYYKDPYAFNPQDMSGGQAEAQATGGGYTSGARYNSPQSNVVQRPPGTGKVQNKDTKRPAFTVPSGTTIQGGTGAMPPLLQTQQQNPLQNFLNFMTFMQRVGPILYGSQVQMPRGY